MYSFGKPSTDANTKSTPQSTPQTMTAASYFPFTASTQSTQPMSFFNQVQQTAQQSQQSQPVQQSQQITATSLFSQPTPSTQTQQPSSMASSWFSQPTQPTQQTQQSQQSAQQPSSSFFSQPPQQSQTQQPLSTAPSSQTQSSFFPPPTTASFFPQASTPSNASTPASVDVNQLLTKIVDLQSQTLKLQEQMQTTLSSLTNQSKVVFNRTCDGCNSIAIIGEIHTALNHCVYDLCSDCYKTKRPPGAIFVTVTTTEALEYLLTMQKIIPTKSL
jgi:hypothetical protein